MNILGLSVERVVVNILVVDTVLFTAGDTNFLWLQSAQILGRSLSRRPYHLKPLLHGSSPLQVLGSGLNVPGNLFFRQINHV